MNIERIKLYNKKYMNELKSAINFCMPKLIQAFINVYDANHADYIRYTLSHLNYTYFISPSFIDLFSSFPKINLQAKKILTYYQNYLNHVHKLYTPDIDKDTFLMKYYFVGSDLDSEWLTDENFLSAFRCDTPLFNDLIYKETEDSPYSIIKSVFLPIFTINFYMLVHELNHAMSGHSYFLVGDNLAQTRLFKPVNNEEDIISEELFNDYIANIIIQEYLRIGGIIPPCLRVFKFYNQYQCNSFLVAPFYKTFHKLLLEAYISGNHNLMTMLGDSNFDDYCQYITHAYNQDELQADIITNLDNRVEIMIINYNTLRLQR